MRKPYPFALTFELVALCVTGALTTARAGDVNGPERPNQRIPWRTSRIIGSPEPPAPCQVRRIYPSISFKDPVDLCGAPGTHRLFVAEQGGKIFSINSGSSTSDTAAPDLLFDLKAARPDLNALYGVTFHPGFQTNHHVYICYVLKDGLPDGSRVSRFTVSTSDPPRVDPGTETIMITWLSGGHNGGCIKFGQDSYLYISTGDGAGPNPPDPLQAGQDTSNLLSSILRIDVDHPSHTLAYRIPADNPFLNQPESRPEIWAYGLRNPWRMSFDAKTGALWVADVGWELWEMVYRVERGGNYGWSIVEGPQSIHPDWKAGPTPILPPMKAHPHTEAASITGGEAYHGTRLPTLADAYIYGDWVTGKIWALRCDRDRLLSVEELVDTPLQIVSFSHDRAGELLILDYRGGIYELELNSSSSSDLPFPSKLSETGLFTSTAAHELAPGVLPFGINAEMWSDYAFVERFIGLPDRASIVTGPSNVWLSQTKNDWRYPTNAVLGRTVSLELDRGKRETSRRLETQVLHFDGQDWHAYTYRWNEDQSDATLVAAAGDSVTLEIRDARSPEGRQHQLWQFHSRSECLRCHNPWVNAALAFTGPQLNRPTSQPAPGYTNGLNQLRMLSALGYFDQPLDERARPKLTNPYAPAANLTDAARSWLHVNCSHCHREGAGGSVVSHFDYDSNPQEMKALGRPPSQGTLGLTEANVISPGDPYSSVLYYRICTTGPAHMPLIGSTQVDPRGVKLLHDWIRQSPTDGSRTPAGSSLNRAQRQATEELLQQILEPASRPVEISAAQERLLSSPNGALALLSSINERGGDPPCPAWLTARLTNGPAFQGHDLFERFLPDHLRSRKLGSNIRPEQILQLTGDRTRGSDVFFRVGMQCAQCHRIQGQGRELGPDLSQIGLKYSPAQLLEQIVNPSKVIDPVFIAYQVDTTDDLTYTGFILQRTPEGLVVRQATAEDVRIPASHIKLIHPQRLSIMPEGLLQAMTAQEAADLLAFLSSLR